MVLTTPNAELGGTLTDALVYGLYLSIFTHAVQVLYQRKVHDRTSTFLMVTTGALFCLITAHLGLDMDRAFRAFTSNIATPNYPKEYFNILSGPEALAKNSAYVTITLIADFFLVFRCWAAFGQNYFIILIPSALYIGNLATACWALVTFKQAENPTTGVVIVAEVISRVKFMYITTLCLNVYCSLSIATRIWLVQRQSIGTGGHLFKNTITIVVESAALYSIFLIILITSAALENPLMYAILNPMPSIIGFVFSSIIVRVGSGQSFSTQRPSGGQLTYVRSVVSALRFGNPHHHGEETTTFDDGVIEAGHGTILSTASLHFPTDNRTRTTATDHSSAEGLDTPKEEKGSE